jgi:hypothetical protein
MFCGMELPTLLLFYQQESEQNRDWMYTDASYSHCNTCKILSGGPYTLNQIIPASALSITKGKDNLGKYTYKGDSGKDVDCVSPLTLSTH